MPGKQTVWQIVKEQKIDLTRPTVCLVDGVAKLRKDWNCILHQKAVVSFVALPQGGGGGKSSNPLQIVLTVALVVATVYTGGAVGAAYGAVWRPKRVSASQSDSHRPPALAGPHNATDKTSPPAPHRKEQRSLFEISTVRYGEKHDPQPPYLNDLS